MIEPKLVGIGQMAFAKAPNQLCCLGLGSCVAVFLYDSEMKFGGVVHCLLPRAPTPSDSPTKYADTGVRRLFKEIVARGCRRERLVAKIIGGAQMFPNLEYHTHDIGADNCKTVKMVLAELGVKIVAEDTKGVRGRSAFFDMNEGIVVVKTAFSPDKVI